MNEREGIVKRFWDYMNEGLYDEVDKLMTASAVVWLPNTREVFKGRDKYVDFNRIYPGRWLMNIDRIMSVEETVVSVVRVENYEKTSSFYAISFFKIKNGLIEEITEFWSENGEPPIWRVQNSFSQRY